MCKTLLTAATRELMQDGTLYDKRLIIVCLNRHSWKYFIIIATINQHLKAGSFAEMQTSQPSCVVSSELKKEKQATLAA